MADIFTRTPASRPATPASEQSTISIYMAFLKVTAIYLAVAIIGSIPITTYSHYSLQLMMFSS